MIFSIVKLKNTFFDFRLLSWSAELRALTKSR